LIICFLGDSLVLRFLQACLRQLSVNMTRVRDCSFSPLAWSLNRGLYSSFFKLFLNSSVGDQGSKLWTRPCQPAIAFGFASVLDSR
jgi:hypothetical protein